MVRVGERPINCAKSTIMLIVIVVDPFHKALKLRRILVNTFFSNGEWLGRVVW